MQFFPNMPPAATPPFGTSKKTVSDRTVASGSESRSALTKSGNSFLESLNKELAASGVTPVVDTSTSDTLPSGFRILSRDRKATLDSEDIAFISSKLKKRGVSEAALTGIEGLLQAGSTPTIGNVMARTTKQERTSDPLTDEERMTLRGTLAKMQLPTEDIESVEAFMDSGQGAEALRLINKTAGNLTASGISLDHKEMRTLLRGLDLSEKTQTEIRPLLGTENTKSFTGADLERVLGPAAKQFAQEGIDRETLVAELKDVINEALHVKKMREAAAPVSDARGSRQSERTETRILDDLTAKASELGKNVLDQAKAADKSAAEGTAMAGEQPMPHDHGHKQEASDQANDQATDQATDQAKQRHTLTLAPEARPTTKTTEEQRTSSARDGLLGGIDRIETPASMTVPTQQVAQQQGQAAPGAAQTAPQAFAHREEIFAQVEQGMLRQMQNGSHQITLQLDPGDLGQISVMLTVKGGEVRATLRADNAETAAVLSEQMAQLRISLEEQGLKVTELTVDTQLPKDTTQGQEWTGMAQYNQEQEQREQERFMRLARMRRESGTNLARDMQSKDMREEIAAQGLHIIA